MRRRSNITSSTRRRSRSIKRKKRMRKRAAERRSDEVRLIFRSTVGPHLRKSINSNLAVEIQRKAFVYIQIGFKAPHIRKPCMRLKRFGKFYRNMFLIYLSTHAQSVPFTVNIPNTLATHTLPKLEARIQPSIFPPIPLPFTSPLCSNPTQ